MDMKIVIATVGVNWGIIEAIVAFSFKAGKLTEKTDNQQKGIDANRKNIGQIFSKLEESKDIQTTTATKLDMVVDLIKNGRSHG